MTAILRRSGIVVKSILEPARLTSLSQTLIKLTAPGVPDIYQGTELWTLSLVDPTIVARWIMNFAGSF